MQILATVAVVADVVWSGVVVGVVWLGTVVDVVRSGVVVAASVASSR